MVSPATRLGCVENVFFMFSLMVAARRGGEFMRNRQTEVNLRCGCGSDQFEYDENGLERGIRCTKCNHQYSQSELEIANRRLLEKESEKLAQAALSDMKVETEVPERSLIRTLISLARRAFVQFGLSWKSRGLAHHGPFGRFQKTETDYG